MCLLTPQKMQTADHLQSRKCWIKMLVVDIDVEHDELHQYLKTEILRYPSKNQSVFLFTNLRCMFLKQFLNLTQTTT